MRLRAILFAATALGAAGAGAYELAQASSALVERETDARLTEAFKAAAADWIRLRTDGLIVALSGEAPDEAARLHAIGIAEHVVDPRRIEDVTTVRVANPVAPPEFELELLRNEAEVSLIGLAPEPSGREAIRAGLDKAGLSTNVTDMLETVAHPVPAGWADSLAFGLSVLAELPRAKISIEPGHVGVMAVTDTDADREQLEARLRAERPKSVRMDLDISAPRPVIAPFAVDFTYRDGVGHFDACAAESVADVVEIGVAARQVGLSGEPDCKVGLGAPSPDWAAAVARGLAALQEMGGGRFAVRDIEATLTGPDGVSPEKLTSVGAWLDSGLPGVFSLNTVMPPRMRTLPGGEQVYAPRFNAVLLPDGTVNLSGSLQNATSRDAVQSYAAALFGHDRVVNTTVIDPHLPEGWPGRVLVGVAALAELKEGALEVTPEHVSLSGKGNDAEAHSTVAALLAAKVGDGASIDVTFDPVAAAKAQPAVVVAHTPPRREICAAEIAAILGSGSIQFAAGSSEIEDESRGVILAIADVLRTCPYAAFEIGGYTDSQGRAEVNQRLSEERATAVMAALREADLPLVTLTARGHGAEEPIADNKTEEGRARNRRIAFTPIPPVPEAGTVPEPQPIQTSDAPAAEALRAVHGSGDEPQ